MEIIVGRHGNQPFAITDKSVSGKHLKVTTLGDGKVQIEDLGSTNGTFVGGQRIIKKVVTPETIVTLGSSYQLRISDVIGAQANDTGSRSTNTDWQTVNPTKPKQQAPESVSIAHLERIYEEYSETKVSLQKENARKQFLRTLPGLASTLLFGLTFLLGDAANELRPFVGIIMIAGIALSSIMAYKGQQQLPEKMEELNKQFMIDYVCPKCKNFLGFLPFESIKNRGYCTACKTKWK